MAKKGMKKGSHCTKFYGKKVTVKGHRRRVCKKFSHGRSKKR